MRISQDVQQYQQFQDENNKAKKTLTSYRDSKKIDEYSQSLLQSKQQESQIHLIHSKIMEKLALDHRNASKYQSNMVSKQIEEMYENDQIILSKRLQSELISGNQHYENNFQEFIVYKRRYLQLALFAMIQSLTCIIYGTVSPIAAQIVVVYDSSSSIVNLAMLLYLFGHPLLTFPASHLINVYGNYLSLLIGAVLSLASVWLKIFVNDVSEPIYLIIAAQVIGGLGRPFIVNCQSRISMQWFSPGERNMVTSMLSYNVMLSTTVGSLIPGLIFGSYEATTDFAQNGNYNEGERLTKQLMWVQAILGSVLALPVIFLAKNQPPTPPSFAAMTKKDTNFKQSFIELFKNRNFVLLFINYSLLFGGFKALSVISSYLLQPFKMNSSNVAIIQISPIFSGLISTAIAGIILKKYRCYKLLMSGACILSAGFMMLQYPFFLTEKMWVMLLGFCILGLPCIPATPIMIEYGIEATYPVNDALSIGILFSGAMFGGMILGQFGGMIVKGDSKEQSLYGLIFLAATYFIGFIIVFFQTEDLRRTKAEQEAQEIIGDAAEEIGFQTVKEKGHLKISKHMSTVV